jgi:hypothetical protein
MTYLLKQLYNWNCRKSVSETIFGDTRVESDTTQMCRDTLFEKHNTQDCRLMLFALKIGDKIADYLFTKSYIMHTKLNKYRWQCKYIMSNQQVCFLTYFHVVSKSNNYQIKAIFPCTWVFWYFHFIRWICLLHRHDCWTF